MANLDNTVIAAILLTLSGHPKKVALWNDLIKEAPKLDSYMARFFRGKEIDRSRNHFTHRSWWPDEAHEQSRIRFELQVKRFFLRYMAEEEFSVQQQRILDTCRAMGVSPAALEALAEKADADAIIEYLFACAAEENSKESVPQFYLQKTPSRSSVPGVLSDQALIEEGCVLTQLSAALPPRQEHSDALFFPQFAAVRRNGHLWRLAYKELFGSAKPGQGEYIEGKNLSYAYEDWQANLRSRVLTLDFDQELAAERAVLAEKYGYHQHPAKLCLAHYLEEKQEDNNGVLSSALTMTFGQSGYLEHHVYQKDLARNPTEQLALQALFRNAKGNIPALRYCPWAACGGGVWVVTRDNFLVLSLRTNVAEEPGKLGYSSSGSYGRYTQQNGQQRDNTPGLAMCKELQEELGLEDISPQDLTLISLGIDLNRCLIQFSYLLEAPLTAEDILFCRQDLATTADEQIICFVALDTPDLCWSLLEQCEFEPGAAYSLVRLLQKRFGTA